MVGGQAVMEGVMMRAPGAIATAVRREDGKIVCDVKKNLSLAATYPIFKWPILRGMASFVESLIIGVQTIMYSAQMYGEEDGEELTTWQMVLTLMLGAALAMGLFVALPLLATSLLQAAGVQKSLLALIEGVLRLLIFLAYIATVGLMPSMRRFYQYHGAEHKSIYCFESTEPLTVANVRKFSRFHPRCGTAFLLVVMVVSILVFSFVGWSNNVVLRVVERLLALPLVAGLSYEVIRAAGLHPESRFWKVVLKPGLWLQLLTTREPDDEMLEVAIEALNNAVHNEAPVTEAAAAASSDANRR
jgi:uncharacterized protein YqhQ